MKFKHSNIFFVSIILLFQTACFKQPIKQKYTIHKDSDISNSYKVIEGSSTVYKYKYFRDRPNVSDDNYVKILYFKIVDIDLIELGQEIELPNNNINAKAMEWGAWIGSHYYSDLKGKIKFNGDDENITIIDSLYSEELDTEESFTICFKGGFEF